MYRHLPSAAESLLKNARDAADKVLCLPIYPDLDIAAQNKIIQVIRCAK
jgi:dTDP-4-amino-4,6-dideoxygalactose transaminase